MVICGEADCALMPGGREGSAGTARTLEGGRGRALPGRELQQLKANLQTVKSAEGASEIEALPGVGRNWPPARVPFPGTFNFST